jgi:hypothetical protein
MKALPTRIGKFNMLDENWGQFIAHFNGIAVDMEIINRSKGFNNAETDDLRLHALIHAEIAEATEACRTDAQSKKIPGFTGQEEELADAIIRIMTMAAAKKLNVAEAMKAKAAYNKDRPFKHGNKKV